MTLTEVLEAAADTDSEVTRRSDSDGRRAWSLGNVVIVTLDASGRVAAFRLDTVLAAAAQRTPDAGASDLGPEWVEFAPKEVDDHAVDRAAAWFAASARRAGG